MSKDELNEALNYYEIKDKTYIENCIECLNFINNNAAIIKIFNKYHDILFKDKTNKIRDLWNYKKIEELQNNSVNPFITNILLLSGYKYHISNMNKKEFDEYQIKTHKNKVKESLLNDIINRKLNGIRLSQMLWGAYLINCRIIEIGRLQYEYYSNDTIKIHIPKNGRLDFEDVKQSIQKSSMFIEKYYHTKNFKYICESWLLSKQIHKLVKKDSNIYKFYGLFEIEEGDDCFDDILNFIFEIESINDYNKLSETTSLQRKIKKYLLMGNKIFIGHGILKK